MEEGLAQELHGGMHTLHALVYSGASIEDTSTSTKPTKHIAYIHNEDFFFSSFNFQISKCIFSLSIYFKLQYK